MDWGDNFVLLETLRKDKENSQTLLFADPVNIITCHQRTELQKSFRQIERYLQKGFYLAGFLSYEMGYALEEALISYSRKQDYPLIWLGVYNKPFRLNSPVVKNIDSNYYLSEPLLATDFIEYKNNVDAIQSLIGWGETYQINYTSKYKFNFTGNIFDFYTQLKNNQKVSYSALINYNDNFIISLSPELFFRIANDRDITVKPMKGTAPIGSSSALLSADPKNTSENVMIVDLLRNDLGRICLPGSVCVKKLFTIEKYKTLLQMTSTITGRLQPQVKLFDIIQSLFPCGSVTGAPKIQSMKIIRSLEKGPRNIYTGAIGYFNPDGQAVFNVAIRTIDLQLRPDKKYKAFMGVGSGIVYDSKPDEEYQECQIKAQFLTKAIPQFALIETMLFTDSKIKYLDLHLRRLKKSARYFGISCDITTTKKQLQEYAKYFVGKMRLRLLLKSNGEIVLEHLPIIAPITSRAIVLSSFKTKSNNSFLYHKSTHRNLYDKEFKKFSAKNYFDVIFCNEKNEITEGAVSNIFIQTKGRYFTPPLSCGLLHGIQRQIMIGKLKAKERILYLKDLKNADKIILTNSVRGATEVILKKSC